MAKALKFPTRTHLSFCFLVWIECFVKIVERVVCFRNWEPCYELSLQLIIMTYMPVLCFSSCHLRWRLEFLILLECCWLYWCGALISLSLISKTELISWTCFPGCELRCVMISELSYIRSLLERRVRSLLNWAQELVGEEHSVFDIWTELNQVRSTS